MISIVIPCYNQAEYLPDAIESALNQKCEVIVVDDGSTDGSGKIADSYKVKVIHQVNKGLPTARNTGIMNAKGDYIQFLDADDILMEGAMNKIRKTIKETKADIVAPSFKCFGVENHEIILSKDLTVDSFLTANRIPYCSCFKKSALLTIGGYNPKMRFGWEDYDMTIDLLKRGKSLVTLPEVLVMYRTKPVSMITEANKHATELQQQMRLNHPELSWPILPQ